MRSHTDTPDGRLASAEQPTPFHRLATLRPGWSRWHKPLLTLAAAFIAYVVLISVVLVLAILVLALLPGQNVTLGIASGDPTSPLDVTLAEDTVVEPDLLVARRDDFTEKERGDAMTKFKADVQAKAREKGIVEKAARNAELVIRNFVLGFLPPDYTVDIIPQEPVDASQQGSTGAQHGISAPQQGITAPQEGFVPARKGGSGQ